MAEYDADDPMPESHIKDDEAAKSASDKEVWECALTEFDAVSVPQVEMRAESLEDRRFTVVTGAMWEGAWGEQFENSPRPEVDKISKSKDKILNDWNENRVVVDFVPADSSADEMTAETLDGMYRADCYHYKAMQARDNAMREAVGGGFGAYRLSTDYEDPNDPDNDHQRVIPGIIIPDADQSVYFYGGVTYDKSDAQSAFIITRDLLPIAKAKWGEANLTPWPSNQWKWQWDWYTPDVACIAEYYKVEVCNDRRVILTNPLTDEEQRYYSNEISSKEISDMLVQGWKKRERKVKRNRVHKYILNGTGILKDCGYIAGENIPIVPVYGNREWVDNQEHWWGYTRKRKDRQRILNTAIGSFVETASIAPYEVPIVAPEQMTTGIAEDWARSNIDRKPFRYLLPLRNEATGEIVSAGPIGKMESPQPSPATAQLLQLVMAEAADDEQNVDQVKSNTSYDSMDLAASRIDGKSAIYLDNGRQSVQREGEIYESMSRDTYFEEGREVPTLSDDGQDGTAILSQPHVDDKGVYSKRNDLSKGRYKVVATVQEATATKRQKSVKDSLALAEVANASGDQELAQAQLLNAALNMDGMSPGMIKWMRMKAVAAGFEEPTAEEKQQMEQAAQQQQQPNPAEQLAQAQIEALGSKSKSDEASAIQKIADAHLKTAQAEVVGGPEKAPEVPTGLDDPNHPSNVVDMTDKLAGANLKNAQARKINHDIGHQTIKFGHEVEQDHHQREMDRRAQDLAESNPAA